MHFRSLALTLVLALTGCLPATAPSGAAPVTATEIRPTLTGQTIEIANTTQANVGNLRIATGNIWDDDYVDAAGAKHHAATATLFISVAERPGEYRALPAQRVYVGQIVQAGVARLEVTAINSSRVQLVIAAP